MKFRDEANYEAYGIEVRKVDADGEQMFEACVRELPDIREYAETADAAYKLALDTIETTAEIFKEKGRAFPLPSTRVDDFSGRITLRLSKSIHRKLHQRAEAEGVSLNQHIVEVLTHDCGAREVFATVMQTTKEWTEAVVYRDEKRKQPNLGQKVVQMEPYRKAVGT